jgi:hypothetical protein
VLFWCGALGRFWHEAADHILICEGRFRGEADKQGRVASTAWVEDDPQETLAESKSRNAAVSRDAEVCYLSVGSTRGAGSETARVHYAARWCGCGVAARDARAAASGHGANSRKVQIGVPCTLYPGGNVSCWPSASVWLYSHPSRFLEPLWRRFGSGYARKYHAQFLARP